LPADPRPKGKRLADLLENVSKAADTPAEQLVVQKLTEIEGLRKRIE
jgi:hypothetical protein